MDIIHPDYESWLIVLWLKTKDLLFSFSFLSFPFFLSFFLSKLHYYLIAFLLLDIMSANEHQSLPTLLSVCFQYLFFFLKYVHLITMDLHKFKSINTVLAIDLKIEERRKKALPYTSQQTNYATNQLIINLIIVQMIILAVIEIIDSYGYAFGVGLSFDSLDLIAVM